MIKHLFQILLLKTEDCQAGNLSEENANQIIDLTSLHLLPGVIDTQVHFREPGLEHKEDLNTGTKGAVLGGITGVFEMPNTNPSTTNESALKEKLRRAEGRLFVIMLSTPVVLKKIIENCLS